MKKITSYITLFSFLLQIHLPLYASVASTVDPNIEAYIDAFGGLPMPASPVFQSVAGETAAGVFAFSRRADGRIVAVIGDRDDGKGFCGYGGKSDPTISTLRQTAINETLEESVGCVCPLPHELDHAPSHTISGSGDDPTFRMYVLQTPHISAADIANRASRSEDHHQREYKGFVELDLEGLLGPNLVVSHDEATGAPVIQINPRFILGGGAVLTRAQLEEESKASDGGAGAAAAAAGSAGGSSARSGGKGAAADGGGETPEYPLFGSFARMIASPMIQAHLRRAIAGKPLRAVHTFNQAENSCTEAPAPARGAATGAAASGTRGTSRPIDEFRFVSPRGEVLPFSPDALAARGFHVRWFPPTGADHDAPTGAGASESKSVESEEDEDDDTPHVPQWTRITTLPLAPDAEDGAEPLTCAVATNPNLGRSLLSLRAEFARAVLTKNSLLQELRRAVPETPATAPRPVALLSVDVDEDPAEEPAAWYFGPMEARKRGILSEFGAECPSIRHLHITLGPRYTGDLRADLTTFFTTFVRSDRVRLEGRFSFSAGDVDSYARAIEAEQEAWDRGEITLWHATRADVTELYYGLSAMRAVLSGRGYTPVEETGEMSLAAVRGSALYFRRFLDRVLGEGTMTDPTRTAVPHFVGRGHYEDEVVAARLCTNPTLITGRGVTGVLDTTPGVGESSTPCWELFMKAVSVGGVSPDSLFRGNMRLLGLPNASLGPIQAIALQVLGASPQNFGLLQISAPPREMMRWGIAYQGNLNRNPAHEALSDVDRVSQEYSVMAHMRELYYDAPEGDAGHADAGSAAADGEEGLIPHSVAPQHWLFPVTLDGFPGSRIHRRHRTDPRAARIAGRRFTEAAISMLADWLATHSSLIPGA